MNAALRIDWDDIADIGLYPVSLTAKLIAENPNKVRSWIDGNPNSDAHPIIHRQLPPINGRTVLGFLDSIEARFVRHFQRVDPRHGHPQARAFRSNLKLASAEPSPDHGTGPWPAGDIGKPRSGPDGRTDSGALF